MSDRRPRQRLVRVSLTVPAGAVKVRETAGQLTAIVARVKGKEAA